MDDAEYGSFKPVLIIRYDYMIMDKDIVVIGAGITGLTCAFRLKAKGKDVAVLECRDRVGGQIHTVRTEGFVFESGPNTGVLKHPEVVELFEQLGARCTAEVAPDSSKRRLIWKGNRFHDLPCSPLSALCTPLFAWKDKLRILGEPWRKRGTDPYESVGSMAARRLGKSFVDYAVDPFLSGVYAGDPYRLPVRLALPLLYKLEQEHGSFVRGAIAKAKQPKSERDRKATKQVFSAEGGLSRLVDALADAIGRDRIVTGASRTRITPHGEGWKVEYEHGGSLCTIHARRVVTTCAAYALPELLPFVDGEAMARLSNLYYAPVVQVGVGVRNTGRHDWRAFGGLVPSCERKEVLGILFPSACFEGRAPQGGAAMACFMGGVRHPEVLRKSDGELTRIVNTALRDMLKYPEGKTADVVRIFRHERAIPQYEASTDLRLDAIGQVQRAYPGLIIAGNLRDGIGLADRIRQAFDVAERNAL